MGAETSAIALYPASWPTSPDLPMTHELESISRDQPHLFPQLWRLIQTALGLIFRHPITGAPVDLRSPLPADLRQSLSVVSLMPELATHQDPLDVFGFYKTDEVLPGHQPDDHDDALD